MGLTSHVPVSRQGQGSGQTEGATHVEIIDIRQSLPGDIVEELRQSLRVPQGVQKRLPTLLLYDEAGLRLFEKITYLDEYYLTGQEIGILERSAHAIAARIADNSILIELGSGVLRKVKILLWALELAGKRVDYYALDLDRAELERTLRDIPRDYRHVRARGLHGTYDDGAAWLTHPERRRLSKCVLNLGSSIGNFDLAGGAAFVKQFADILEHGDAVLLGVDSCKDAVRVLRAYADRDGVTHDFILNGLKHANRLLGSHAFDLQKWSVVDKVDEQGHYAYVTPSEDVVVDGVLIRKGEHVFIEQSLKFSSHEVSLILQNARLQPGARWANDSGDYAIHMAFKSQLALPTNADEYAARPVPSLDEFEQLWKLWDLVAKPGNMIPEKELLSKPINLRNACVFYLGHIPTFLDIQVTKALNGAPTEPSYYPSIFERGVDPDVENPELVHAHSEIPDTWPPLVDILDFQDRVRSRIRGLYKSGAVENDRKVGRVLWLGFEHEVMHLETLLYMLVQSQGMLPPPGVIRPDFSALALDASAHNVPNEWFDVPASDLKVGLDDPDNDDGPDRYFGWDNEKPSRKVHVDSFQAKARPITNGEYAEYLEKNKLSSSPASWTTRTDITNGINHKAANGTIHGVADKVKEAGTNGFKCGHGHLDLVNGADPNRRDFDKDTTQNLPINVGDSGYPTKDFIHGKAVRTVFGAVPLENALSWPVFASYDELAGCATWMGGRIPTREEVESIYAYADELKANVKAKEKSAATIPAVNGHLVNNGVEETPPSSGAVKPSSDALLSPHTHHVDLDEANVGFKHWHPTPVTQNGARLCGRGELGGVWEWTSSALEKHDGFEPMHLYPAYTADFFDKKHNVVLGGSWATHSRIAGRTTFVNWYQHNYPYAWVGARLVRDKK